MTDKMTNKRLASHSSHPGRSALAPQVAISIARAIRCMTENRGCGLSRPSEPIGGSPAASSSFESAVGANVSADFGSGAGIGAVAGLSANANNLAAPPPPSCASGNPNVLSRRSILRVCRAWLMAYAWLALSGPAMAQDSDPTKVDNDSNGLIEIYTLSDLNNMRHDLAGTSYKTSEDDATPDTSGCPRPENPVDHDDDSNTPALQACYGYELMNDLDFDTNEDGRTDIEGDDYWNGGAGWAPIGTNDNRFAATFDGRGHKIANLFIDRDSESGIGLFRALGSSGAIRNLGVVDATVLGNEWVGGLVGQSLGTISASYAVATVSGNSQVGGLVGFGGSSGIIAASYAVATVSVSNGNVGGLIGSGSAAIRASYAVATVPGNNSVGGLVGITSGAITASYAVATVSGNNAVGGLVGTDFGTITDSYFDADIAGLMGDYAEETLDLQTPIMYGETGIYSTWNVDVTGDMNSDDPWDFGTAMQYPGLVLPPLATGACPLAVSAAVAIETAGEQCIHRPVSQFVFSSVDDDHARFDRNHFTNKRNPRIDAQLLLPEDSTVRIAVAGMPEFLTNTAAGGRFSLEVELAEGPNMFDAVGEVVVRLSDGTTKTHTVSLGALTITLDTMPPELTVYAEGDGRFYAEVADANLLTIRYARLDHAAAPTCVAGFAGSGLTPYEPNPANADERLLPALAPDGAGNVGVYCFVAEDSAGNQAVFSSADAVPAALRLRLRVFLESALP